MNRTFVPLSLFALTMWHPCMATTRVAVDNTDLTISRALHDACQLGYTSYRTFSPQPPASYHSNNCTASHAELNSPKIKKNMTENNDALIRKFLTVILSIYKKKLLACIENLKGQDAAQAYKLLNYFDQLYDLIDLLPVAQLLDALDEAIEEIYPLLEFYEFDSFMSWQEWIEKYSWLIPILTGKFVYIIFSKLELFENDECSEGDNGCEAETSKTDQLIDQSMHQPFDVTELTII